MFFHLSESSLFSISVYHRSFVTVPSAYFLFLRYYFYFFPAFDCNITITSLEYSVQFPNDLCTFRIRVQIDGFLKYQRVRFYANIKCQAAAVVLTFIRWPDIFDRVLVFINDDGQRSPINIFKNMNEIVIAILFN